jgi:hypothetical protein
MSIEAFKILPQWGAIEGKFGVGSLSAPPTTLSELRARGSAAGLFFRARGAGRWGNGISIECRYIHANKDLDEWTSPNYIKPTGIPEYDSLVPTLPVVHPAQYGGSQDLRTVISNTTIPNPAYDPLLIPPDPLIPPTLPIKTVRYTDDLKVIVRLSIPKTVLCKRTSEFALTSFEGDVGEYRVVRNGPDVSISRNGTHLGLLYSGKIFRGQGLVMSATFKPEFAAIDISCVDEFKEEYIVRRVVDKYWSNLITAAASVPGRNISIGTVTASASTEIDTLRTMINTHSRLITMPTRQLKRNTSAVEVAGDMEYYKPSTVGTAFKYSDQKPKATSYFNHDFYGGIDDDTIDYMDFSAAAESPVSYTGRTTGRAASQFSADYPYLRAFDKFNLTGGDGFDNPRLFNTVTDPAPTFDKNGKYGLMVESCHLNWTEKYNGAPQELSAICQAKDSKANDEFDSFKRFMLMTGFRKFDLDAGRLKEPSITDFKYLWELITDSKKYPADGKLKDDVLKFFWCSFFAMSYTKKAWIITSMPDCEKFKDCTACSPPPSIVRTPGPSMP